MKNSKIKANNLTNIIFNAIMLNSANHQMIDLTVKLLKVNKCESDKMVETIVENEFKRLTVLN